MNMHKLPEAKIQFTRTIHTSIDSCFKMMIYDWVNEPDLDHYAADMSNT